MRRVEAVLISSLVGLAPAPLLAQGLPGEEPNLGQRQRRLTQADVTSGQLSLYELRRQGLRMFTTPFNRMDGYGDGAFDPNEVDTRAFGQRPTLQGNGTFLRVNGLDAQSCNECHTFVSTGTRPPTLGFGGVGTAVQNAIIMGSALDPSDSNDNRMAWAPGHSPDLDLRRDGKADFNGRFANPPFLFGGGGVELLAKEMTIDLRALLEQAKTSPAGTVIQLETHGVRFGSLMALGGGQVDLTQIDGINEDLVVRPFGRKGENFSMRDFDRGAMQFHFGMEPVEVVGAGVDRDGDGVVDEVLEGEMSALHIFDVTNPPPRFDRMDQDARRGLGLFNRIGCTECHIPLLQTRSRYLPLAHPEVPEDPTANVYAYIDLVRVGFTPAPGGGVLIPLFADLKRHRMGADLEESFEYGDLPNDAFTTGRLWGIADTAPYMHDGRATTLPHAIELHGHDAQFARDAFVALSPADQESILHFLGALRTPRRPNEELLRAGELRPPH